MCILIIDRQNTPGKPSAGFQSLNSHTPIISFRSSLLFGIHPMNSGFFVLPDSHLHLLNSKNLLGSALILYPCKAAWNLSQGRKLGKSQSLPICFLLSRDRCLGLPDTHCLVNGLLSIIFFFLVVLSRRINQSPYSILARSESFYRSFSQIFK